MDRATVLERARHILDEERQALALTLKSVDERFADAIELIARCRGKVVVTGVGKSGLVAQKITATMNSTGTTAAFMHGGDGVHGDLGIVGKQDVVLALSYSGKTVELLANIPTIQRIGAKIVAMVGDEKSQLAQAAHVVLPIRIHREAGWMNLAPTSSTIAMMAMGDALALVLCEYHGFRSEDFALFHPGGALGRRLLLKVADLMHGGEENPMALESAPAAEITDVLTRTRMGGVNIVDNRRSRRLLGIITDGDVRKALGRREEFFTLKARDIMTRDPVRVRLDMRAYDALQLMENRKMQISVLPVVDADNRVHGIVRVHDLLQLNRS